MGTAVIRGTRREPAHNIEGDHVKKVFVLFIAGFIMCLAGAAAAEGPHDMDCKDCHTTHYAKGSYAFGVQPKVEMNPARTKTGANVDVIDSLCLGCHNENKGIKPIKMHTTHPTSVRPTSAKVPPKLLWDGKLTCASCHNPHPSNPNYMYLVIPTNKGNNMGTFCAACHPDQSSPETVKKAVSATIRSDSAQAPIVLVTEKVSPKPAPAVKKPVAPPAKMP